MADAAYLDSASKALGPHMTGTNEKATQEIKQWVDKVNGGSADVSDLKGTRAMLRGFIAKAFGEDCDVRTAAWATAGLGVLTLYRFAPRNTLFFSHRVSYFRRKALDGLLAGRTFLVGNDLTNADLALLSAHYGKVSALPAAEQYAHLNVTRYFSQVSHLAATLPHEAASKYAAFDPAFDGQPAIERKDPVAERKKEKEAKQKATVAAQASSKDAPSAAKSGAAVAGASAVAAGANKKEKKDKKAKEDGGKKKEPQQPAAPTVPIPSQIDLRVGKIVDIKRHPDADSLYLEQVDFGEPEGPRTVLSGLVHYVPMEEMKDRWVVGICNLKPAAMRGIKSHAMLLCATHKDGKEKGVEPILPPEGSTPGERIYIEGYEGLEPDAQLNPKKKVFETIQPHYTTTTSREAAWVGVGAKEGDAESKPRLIRTARGVCMAPSFTEATLS